MSEQKYEIPKPSRHLFANKEATETIMDEDQTVYLIDRISYDNGYPEIYYVGADYPKKGFPTPEAIFQANIVKRLLMQLIKLPLPVIVLSHKSLLKLFIEVGNKAMVGQLVRKLEYLTPVSQEIYKITSDILIELGFGLEDSTSAANLLAHLIEYDDAYRYRIQDICEEMNEWDLQADPVKEINRLMAILKERDDPGVYNKFVPFAKILKLLLYIPGIRQKLRDILYKANLFELQYDDADRYWVCMRDGYKFMGETYEERQKLITNKPQGYKIKR